MIEIKCPKKLDISLFYQLNGKLPHEDLDDEAEMIFIHFYDTFCSESISYEKLRKNGQM